MYSLSFLLLCLLHTEDFSDYVKNFFPLVK